MFIEHYYDQNDFSFFSKIRLCRRIGEYIHESGEIRMNFVIKHIINHTKNHPNRSVFLENNTSPQDVVGLQNEIVTV